MRNTNIISSIANASERFVNAGIEMLAALLPAGQQRLYLLCAGQPANLSQILPGNSGAAFQVRLLTYGTGHSDKDFGRPVDQVSASYLSMTSDRDWQKPGTTSRQTRLGKS